MPTEQRPAPGVYEPIYRYPVDTGGDGAFDVQGFIGRAQALGDTGDHWALASEIIREHFGEAGGPQIRGSYPGNKQTGKQTSAAGGAGGSAALLARVSSAGARTEGQSTAAKYATLGANKYSAPISATVSTKRGAKTAGGGNGKSVPSTRMRAKGGKGGGGRVGGREGEGDVEREGREGHKAYGEDRGACEDGITMSLRDLRTEIAAVGKYYTTANKTIQEISRSHAQNPFSNNPEFPTLILKPKP